MDKEGYYGPGAWILVWNTLGIDSIVLDYLVSALLYRFLCVRCGDVASLGLGGI